MELDPVFVSLWLNVRSERNLMGLPQSLFTAGTLTGFDASGHIAEETKHAQSVFFIGPLSVPLPHAFLFAPPPLNSVVAGRGILSSAIATGVLGFITTILFLFCIPDLDTFFALDAPQPFVQVYALAFGKGPSIFMTIIAVLGLIMVRGRPFLSVLSTS